MLLGAAPPLGWMVATGGTETTSGNFKIHTFNSGGTFTITSNPRGQSVEYLIIAGGGGGGESSAGSGGGAGAGHIAGVGRNLGLV